MDTQAVVTLKNGKRKYGTILDSIGNYVRFLPSLRNSVKKTLEEIIENIPLDQITSIDTYLK